ncbi:MAG TPA: sigma-70 family RNA polymerase sigma factor [Gemmatimonadaceae bacterium]|nr:sigma-70 family RNA polymerase sigma factor [Gemmatimonadaceae bacterium]
MAETAHPDPTQQFSPPRDRTVEFETLLAGVVDVAFGTALRLTMNRQDAEDLVQEAALLAFKAFGGFEPGTNFKAWFFRILTNAFYSSRRRKRPEHALDDLDDVPELYLYTRTAEAGLHGQETDPAKVTLGRMAADDIARALASLPDEFRMVATMYFMEDFSYQEIAEMLGIPVGTVRSRLHRGRKLLQMRLWELAVDQGLVPGGEKA